MADNDQTILSGAGISDVSGSPPPVEPDKPKRNPIVLFGGIGCGLLLCIALFVGGGFFLARDQLSTIAEGLAPTDIPAPTDTPSPEPVPTDTPVPKPTDTPEATDAADSTGGDADSGETAAGSAADEQPPATPEIGSITFALGATDDYEPIDPGTSFEGDVSEIHAIFDYSGFSPELTWERVWFLDDNEMLRGEELWSGGDEGVFDYFINNAGGEPLAAGEWTLELYVEGELLADGSFTIGSESAAVANAGGNSGTDSGTANANSTATAEAAAAEAETPTATPTVTATPRPVAKTYKLAYTKWDGGKHLLFIGDTNGSSEQYLLGRAAGPSWAPDGKTIFFYGEEGIDRQILQDGREFVFDGVSNGIIAIDVSPVPTTVEQIQLFQGLDWKFGTARWANVSPDGQMVAFDAKPSGSYRIYFLGTSDNQQFKFELLGEQGDWSPDSQKVAYRSGRDGKTGIWVSNRDDSGHTLISDNGSDSFPAWSPDGRTIVFHREQDGNVDLYAMNTDGSNVRRLTDAAGPDTLPEWTPSGEIIFRSARSGSWGIWKMNGDGSNQREIIPDAGVGPDWSFSRMSVLP